MVISRKTRARDYKERKPITAFGQVILPLTMIMALALLYLSVKLFFFAPEKLAAERLPYNIPKDEVIAMPDGRQTPADDAFIDDDLEDEVTVTPKKKVKTTPSAKPVQPAVTTVRKPVQTVKTKMDDPPKKNVTTPAPAKPAAKAESGARWDIQIGGFSAKEGAELTVKQAKESGYSVYIVDSVLNGKPFYKVRVRGESDKKSSQELSKRLAKAGFPVYLVEIKR